MFKLSYYLKTTTTTTKFSKSEFEVAPVPHFEPQKPWNMNLNQLQPPVYETNAFYTDVDTVNSIICISAVSS